MPMTMNVVKCPQCGANLSIEEGRENVFCSYCGAQILLTNENEHTYRKIDEAELKRAETDRMVRMKELEMAEKEDEKSQERRKGTYLFALILAGIGFILLLLHVPIGSVVILMAVFVATMRHLENKEPGQKKHILPSDAVRITDSMCCCENTNYNGAEALFRAAGFENVTLVPLRDLSALSGKKDGRVVSVAINGSEDFKEDEVYSKTDKVLITYHSMR